MKKLTGAIIALTFIFASTTYAATEGFGDRITSKLGLTPEQTIQFSEVQAKRQAYMSEALNVRTQIKALIEIGDVDGAAMLAGQQAEKKVHNMYALKTQLASFLTEAQMAILADVRDQVASKRERLKRFIGTR